MSFLKMRQFLASFRNLHTKSTVINRNASSIGVTKDGSTLVAWHAQEDFPYECTKPLPEDKVLSVSSLKTQHAKELMDIFNRKHQQQIVLELANLTHTTKHRWYPRARDKRAKKTQMDRKYL